MIWRILLLFVFFVSFKNFSLIWKRHHYRERLQILTYAWNFWPLSSEGSFACHTYCDTGHYGLLQGPVTLTPITKRLELSLSVLTTSVCRGWDSKYWGYKAFNIWLYACAIYTETLSLVLNFGVQWKHVILGDIFSTKHQSVFS